MTSTGASGASDSEESADQYDPIRKLAMVQLQPPRNPNRPFTAFSIKDILGHRHTNSAGRESNDGRRSEHTVSDVFEPSTGGVVVVSVTDDDDDTGNGRTVTASPPGSIISKSHPSNTHNSHSRYHHYHHHHRHHHHNEQHHSKSHNNTNAINSDKNSPVGIIITDASQRLISHNNDDNNNSNNNNSNNNHNKRVNITLARSEHNTSNNSDYPGEKDHYHHPHSRLHNPHVHLHQHHPKNIIISTPSPPVAPSPLTPPTPSTPPTPQLLHNHNNNLSLKSHTQQHAHQLPHHRGSRLPGTTTTTAISSHTTTTTVNGARIVRPWDTGPESDNNTSSDIDGDEEINVDDDDDDVPIPSIVKTVSPLDALMEMANKTFEGLETSDAVDAKRREQAALFGKHQPPKKRRKSRTAFTNQQIYELEKRFLYQKYLTPADRDEIALSLGLTNAQVITWFQNRRAKLKRDLEEMKNDVEHAKVVTPQLNSLLVKTLVKKTLDCDSLSQQQAMIEEEDEDCHSKDNSVTS